MRYVGKQIWNTDDDDDDDDGGGSDDDDVEDYHQDHDEDSVTCTFLICDSHISDTANLISLFLETVFFELRKYNIQTLPMYLLEIVNDISVQILQGAEWTPFSFYSRSVLRTTATDSANFTCQVYVFSFSLSFFAQLPPFLSGLYHGHHQLHIGCHLRHHHYLLLFFFSHLCDPDLHAMNQLT